jgi:hypothetical protein
MTRWTPELELLMAANSFAMRADDSTRERLRVAAIAAKGRVDREYEQLRVAAERIAGAPRHNWKIAQDALADLIRGFSKSSMATQPEAPATQPIICPHCNELSRPGRVCDVCGEEMKAEEAA